MQTNFNTTEFHWAKVLTASLEKKCIWSCKCHICETVFSQAVDYQKIEKLLKGTWFLFRLKLLRPNRQLITFYPQQVSSVF